MRTHFISHVILGSNHIPEATDFYDQVLGLLGQERRWRSESGAGYGNANEQGIDTFWITTPLDGKPAGACDEGAPGTRSEVLDNFYACYVRDLDGNKIVAACHESP
jgi:catechol 2,3-dioxygenase-like lactoylglutathione lyase family enzyme